MTENRCSNAQRSTRAVALALALFAVTACGVRSTAGTSIDEVDTTSTTDAPTSTTADTIDSTPFENDDPSTTTTTTTTTARRPDIILSEALPERGDVPTGFTEVALPSMTTVEPVGLSQECQAMLDLVNDSSIAQEGRSLVAFSDARTSIAITASIELALEDDTTEMHDFSAFVGKCHAFSHLGIDYTASSAELALADDAFVVHLDFDLPINGTEVAFGVTSVVVLRGDIQFAVSLAGGLRVNGNVIEPLPRDRQLPEELALVIDGKLSYLLSD